MSRLNEVHALNMPSMVSADDTFQLPKLALNVGWSANICEKSITLLVSHADNSESNSIVDMNAMDMDTTRDVFHADKLPEKEYAFRNWTNG